MKIVEVKVIRMHNLDKTISVQYVEVGSKTYISMYLPMYQKLSRIATELQSTDFTIEVCLDHFPENNAREVLLLSKLSQTFRTVYMLNQFDLFICEQWIRDNFDFKESDPTPDDITLEWRIKQ